MSATPIQAQQIDEILSQQLGSFTKLPKINVPNTTIINRAQCVDPSSDHLPKFGNNRVMFEFLSEVQGEYGPSGQRVFKPQNDQFDQVRFVDSWNNGDDTNGPSVSTGTQGGYMEITFYGTGLNLLFSVLGSSASYTAAVDGGVDGANFMTFASTYSSVIDARNYGANHIVSVVSGLTLGTHTVKITRQASGGGFCNFYGYEVLNTNSTLQYVSGTSYSGGKKLVNASLVTDGYNSTFESGTLSASVGGHVVVYQKSDGTIKKAVQSNTSGTLYLSSANHTNESIIRIYNFREFGAARGSNVSNQFAGDDFSTTLGVTTISAAFTLDDGTTTLIGNNVGVIAFAGSEGVSANALNAFLTFTFIGTGLDLEVAASVTSIDTQTVLVDGNSAGTITTISLGGTWIKIPIVSGLPYGTHTVQITRTTFIGAALSIRHFIIYGPTKPSVPSNALELCDYYLLGTYSPTSSATYNTTGVLSQGTIVKYNMREIVYSGSGISIGSIQPASFWSGFRVNILNPGEFAQYVFFGTALELYVEGNGSGVTATISIDGSLYTGAATVTGASLTWTPGSSTLSWSSAQNNIVQINNLGLGLHTVKLSKTSSAANTMLLDAIGFVTPIHTPKTNVPGDIQATPLVGSQGIGDSRKFSSQVIKTLPNWAQAFGVFSSPATTNAASFVPVPDLAVVIKTSGNPVDIFYSMDLALNATVATNYTQTIIYVNGASVSSFRRVAAPTASTPQPWGVSDRIIVALPAGIHMIQVYWSMGNTGTNVLTSVGTERILIAKEL